VTRFVRHILLIPLGWRALKQIMRISVRQPETESVKVSNAAMAGRIHRENGYISQAIPTPTTRNRINERSA